MCKLDDEAFEVFREAHNINQQKCMQALEFDLTGDTSKTNDRMLRVVVVIQTIECCLECLEKNPNFEPASIDPT